MTEFSVTQIMAIRMACSEMLGRLERNPNALGPDHIGQETRKEYIVRLREVLAQTEIKGPE